MKKIYIKPEISTIVCQTTPILGESNGPKVDGSVIDGPKFEFGGDGSSTDEPDAKPFDPWNVWED